MGRHIRAIGDGVAEGDDGAIGETVAKGDVIAEVDGSPDWDFPEEPPIRRRLWPTVAAVLAGLAVLGWTAFFILTHHADMLAQASPDQWIDWTSRWATPVLLVAVAWLIAMRSSARESARFGDVARLLSHESTHLEARLVAVNRELSLAREFLAAQSRELEYLGRSAAERIAEHAGKLQALVIDNGAQVEAIAGVSMTALENMAQLRDNLPVIANSARDVTNQIGGAGRSAKVQLGELIAGFERLNEFGQASERQVGTLRQRIDTALEHLGAFVDRLDSDNAARIAALRSESEGLRAELEAREAEVHDAIRQRGETLRAELVTAHDARQLEEAAALAAMRGRIAAFTREAHDAAATIRSGERTALELWEGQVADLRSRLEQALEEVAVLDRQALDQAREKLSALTAEAEEVDRRLVDRDREFQDRVARRQGELDDAETTAFARLAERAAAFDEELAARHQAQLGHTRVLGEHGEALAARVAEIEAHIAGVVERGGAAERALASSAEHFVTTVNANADQLDAAETRLARLTDASVRLLELIQAAASHSRSELPAAIEGFEGRLVAAREDSAAIRGALDDAHRLGSELADILTDMHRTGESAIGDLETLRTGLSGTSEEQTAALGALRAQLAATAAENRALAETVADGLTAAIEQLKLASTTMLFDLEESETARIDALSARIGEESGRAIDRAMEACAQEAVARLDEATVRSADAAREAVAGLRDQLARVHELTVNLEARASRAREQVEEQIDGDFSRRMALITESLNSHAIDIARALSTEVTDIAWASYLKGDRGVFTRRAVRLVDAGQARAIAELFEGDHEFREHVSRYIHDFEAMLRTVLSTRDGHALGVTLLSSDMGKLYVALAQAIQRLRQ